MFCRNVLELFHQLRVTFGPFSLSLNCLHQWNQYTWLLGRGACTKLESMIIWKWRGWAAWVLGAWLLLFTSSSGPHSLLVPTYHRLPMPTYHRQLLMYVPAILCLQYFKRNFAIHLILKKRMCPRYARFWVTTQKIFPPSDAEKYWWTFWERFASLRKTRQDEYDGFGQSS